MRAAIFLSLAALLTGTACQAGNIPDIAVDTLHGYAFQNSIVTNVDSEGKPHIFPREIESVTYASLEDARKYFQDRADSKVAEIAPQRSNLFASVRVVQSDKPADESFADAQYKLWLDDTVDGKQRAKRPGGAAWIVVNKLDMRRMVPQHVGR